MVFVHSLIPMSCCSNKRRVSLLRRRKRRGLMSPVRKDWGKKKVKNNEVRLPRGEGLRADRRIKMRRPSNRANKKTKRNWDRRLSR
jgi:hypothetical protein